MIPNPTQLHHPRELGVPEHFSAHAFLPDVLFIHADCLCARVDTDDALREAFLKFVRQVGWDWLLQDDVW